MYYSSVNCQVVEFLGSGCGLPGLCGFGKDYRYAYNVD